MGKYLEMPWSVEDTIKNLEELKDNMQEKVKLINLHGRGEKDAEEVAFDFDRAIKALEKQIPVKPDEIEDKDLPDVWYTCQKCNYDLTHLRLFYCPNCGQKLMWN